MSNRLSDNIAATIKASIEAKQGLLQDQALLQEIERVIQLAIQALESGNKILFAGNGGSAADAQHLATELMVRYYINRRSLPAIALTTDSSLLTAASNDLGYDQVFSRQIEGLGNKGDLFFAITTSGNSGNILAAVEACKARGVISIGMTGAGGGKLQGLCDHLLCVPSKDTPRIQEAHILIGHIICDAIERHFQE